MFGQITGHHRGEHHTLVVSTFKLRQPLSKSIQTAQDFVDRVTMEEGCQERLDLVYIDPESNLIHLNNELSNPFNVARFEDEGKQVVNIVSIDLRPAFHLSECG